MDDRYTTRGHQQPECFCTMIADGFQADFQPDRARFLDERDDHDDPSLHAKTRVEWMTDTRRAALFFAPMACFMATNNASAHMFNVTSSADNRYL